MAGLDEAGPGDLTFLANPRYLSKLPHTRASAAIVDESVSAAPCPLLKTPRPAPGISALASIDPSAVLGPGVSVGAFASIGPGVRVGARTAIYPHVVIGAGAVLDADCVLHAHASIREGVIIGQRVTIQDAAVVGSDGFGFARRDDGTHQKIPQVGRVVIEDDVELGAHSAVDRPAIGETRIGRGTKIDNLVQIAHGVRVGRNTLLAAQVGIAGSTVLGDGVVMAGQSGAAGHLQLGRGAQVSAKSAVTKDVADGEHVAGIPAGDVTDWRESVVLVRRLPELRKAVAELERRLAALEARLMT